MPDFRFDEMARLLDEINRFGAGLRGPSADDGWAPQVDIHEREDALVLVLDLPGVKKEDIELQVDGSGITLEGRRPRAMQAKDLRLERPVGRFRRSVRIDVPIEPSRTQASYRDGVLEITVPKAQISGPTRVKVDVT